MREREIKEHGSGEWKLRSKQKVRQIEKYWKSTPNIDDKSSQGIQRHLIIHSPANFMFSVVITKISILSQSFSSFPSAKIER